ncbi:MAG: O-antigen ligase family protein [Verrucomicrobiota bacterium]|nr:O-antigen ligase family protein [Verrucomicrobiota bacterium]
MKISRSSAIRNATRLLFLSTLFYAPWAYGCTTAESIVGLDWLLGAVVVLWLGDLLIRRERPHAPTTLAILVGLLLAFGWGMALNGRAVYDPVFAVFMPAAHSIAALPGSYDAVNSVAFMIRCTVLLLSLLFVADLVQRPQWLLRLWYAVAAAGASIALLGLIQKASGARMIFWGDWLATEPPSFFAAYFYHANAGAYLNLAFPPTVALAARAFGTPTSPVVRALWATAALAVTVAILANTSRAAQFLGVCLMLIVLVMSRRQLSRAIRGAEKGTLIVGAMVAIVALYAVAQASRLDKPFKRWAETSSSVAKDSRWGATLTALPAARDAGWFGFGPASFRSVFPHYVEAPESKVEGTWRFLHEDYLQTIIEWGWIGGTLWAVLFFGGMMVAWRNFYRARETWLPRQRVLIPLLLLALASVAVHALVDFPLQIASIQLYVVTYLGVCWGACSWKQEEGKHVKLEIRSKRS